MSPANPQPGPSIRSLRTSRVTRALALSAAAALVTTIAPVASASGGGGGDVRAQGACSARSTWKLTAKPDNARLEAEFEVDSNVVGQKWTVTIRDNTVLRHTGTHTTTAPSGSFTARSLMPDMAGDDRIVARATNPATGEICVGRVTYPA